MKKKSLIERKCRWCGSVFSLPRSRRYNSVKYCSQHCKTEARREKQREYTNKWRKKVCREENHGYQLGESRINEHPSQNFDKEINIIRREMRRIGL